MTRGVYAVSQYIQECRDLGFDIVEVSSGFVTLPLDDWLRLFEKVAQAGLKPKPEVGIQFGAGGVTAAAELEAEAPAIDNGRSLPLSDFWRLELSC